jgi:hypothetical protein
VQTDSLLTGYSIAANLNRQGRGVNIDDDDPLLLSSSRSRNIRILNRRGGSLYSGDRPIRLISYSDLGIMVERDFDYRGFFNTLQDNNINMVRVWLSYPWAGADMIPLFRKKSGQYDVTQVNSRFLRRLGNFVGEAEQRGIVVQVSLFTGSELQGMGWANSPYNPKNNVNQLGFSDNRFADYSGSLWQRSHKPLIETVGRTLKDRGNVIYEIANEPEAHAIDSNSAEFHKVVANTLLQALQGGIGSKVISVNLDDKRRNSKLANWALDPSSPVGLVSTHYVSGRVADQDINTSRDIRGWFRNLSKPALLSNDGDVTQFQDYQGILTPDYDFDLIRGDKRSQRVKQVLTDWFSGDTKNGRLGFDFLAKELNGLTWNKPNYEPYHLNTDSSILNTLKGFTLPNL